MAVTAEGPAAALPPYKPVLDAVLARSPQKAEKAAAKLVEAAGLTVESALQSKRKLPALKKAPTALKAPKAR